MRQPQARPHTDRREREEHRAEEKQEAERLRVARRLLRVEQPAVCELHLPRDAVIRRAHIALRRRVVERQELLHRLFDVRRLRRVRVVVKNTDVRRRTRETIFLEVAREIQHGDRLVLIKQLLRIRRRVEHRRDLHVLRRVDARDELARVRAVVEVDDDDLRILRKIARQQHREDHRHHHRDEQAHLLIRHALAGKQESELALQSIQKRFQNLPPYLPRTAKRFRDHIL